MQTVTDITAALDGPADQQGSSVMQVLIVGLSFAIGCIARWACLGHVSGDTFTCLLPWYDYSLRHGWGALATAYTNYTPFYSYILIASTYLDGFVSPWTMIKSISFVFEFAMACFAYAMVRRMVAEPPRLRPAAAFAGVWLAPTVIANGAFLGQCDSLWTLVVMLTVAVYCAGRNGMPGFAVALAIKAQAAFLGPFVLGMALRRRMPWAWFAAIPAIYLVLALPVLIAGRSLVDIASIYPAQAGRFQNLSMNAANLWVFVPLGYYAVGTVCGLLLAAIAGCILAGAAARTKRSDPSWILLFACTALLMMPYLMPKMHDRYFYAFEVAAIVLACIDLRFLGLAIIAQVDGAYAYAAYEGFHFGLPIGALSNGVLLIWLVRVIRAGGRIEAASWVRMVPYAVCVAGSAVTLPAMEANPQAQPLAAVYWLLCAGIVLAGWRLLPKIEPLPRAERTADGGAPQPICHRDGSVPVLPSAR